MENFEKYLLVEETDEEVFQKYIEDLKLSPEDFNKKILDVGAGSAKFAKWAKEHGVSKEIFSLEPRSGIIEEKDQSVCAQAETMPFRDESFDLVISDAAIPNIYIKKDDTNEKVTNSFNEMLRVLKLGGEVRLARVLIGKEYESQMSLAKSITEVLDNLEKTGDFEIEKIRTPSDDTYEYVNHDPVKVLAESYLIIIRKIKES